MMTTSNEHNNAPAVPVTCGNGCDCLAQCGDAYAHAGLPKPRQAEATSQGWPFGELSDGQIMATVGRMGELVNYLKLGQQWDGICNLVRQIIRERYTLYATPSPAPAVPQGYEIHEIPADYSGLVWLEGQVRAVARRAQAATGPQGWTDADSDAARLALELECLLMDTKDLSVVSKWWGSANDALELHRQRLAATPAPAPAQSFDEVWYSIDWNEWRMKPIRELIQMIHSKTAPASAQEPAHQYTQHVIAGGGEITVTKDGKPAYVITAREASQEPNK